MKIQLIQRISLKIHSANQTSVFKVMVDFRKKFRDINSTQEYFFTNGQVRRGLPPRRGRFARLWRGSPGAAWTRPGCSHSAPVESGHPRGRQRSVEVSGSH